MKTVLKVVLGILGGGVFLTAQPAISASPTVDSWARRADHICKPVQHVADRHIIAANAAIDREDWGEAGVEIRAFNRIMRPLLRRLEGLKHPQPGPVVGWLKAQGAQIAAMERLSLALRRGKIGRAAAANRAARKWEGRSTYRAKRLHLRYCE
jgi:hypothetical protein